MGLIYGSGSFTRFLVQGPLPKDHPQDFSKRISRFAFQKIDEASEQERSVGWVNIMDVFDNRLASMEFLKEPCIALSWRVDVRRVPKKALLQYCREAEERAKESEGIEFLSKKRREEIRETVRVRLLKRAIPVAQTYDMIWNLHASALIFGSVSNKLCDEFAEFFLQCFDLRLQPLFPHRAALQILQKEGMDATLLDTLKPCLREAG